MLAAGLAVGAGIAHAQTPTAGPLLDALSITVQRDSATVARGSIRLRQFRTGTDVELVASGIVVRRGMRITAELRTDTVYAFRRYQAESRDSSGVVVDRITVLSIGGRITYERVTRTRRMAREFGAQRDLMIVDTAAVVPFVMLAGAALRSTPLAVLDVRTAALAPFVAEPAAPITVSIAEVLVSGTPVSLRASREALTWWRDARGRLLGASWGPRSRVLRDDPPP